MKKFILTAALLVLVTFLSVNPVLADDASLGRIGESVQPIFNTQVEMLAEDVKVTVKPDKSLVEAVFTFRNNGPATKVLVGFPEVKTDPEREEFRDDCALHDFKASVDGRAVPVKRERGLVPEVNPRQVDYPSWYTWEVSFAAGETKILRNTYWGALSADA